MAKRNDVPPLNETKPGLGGCGILLVIVSFVLSIWFTVAGMIGLFIGACMCLFAAIKKLGEKKDSGVASETDSQRKDASVSSLSLEALARQSLKKANSVEKQDDDVAQIVERLYSAKSKNSEHYAMVYRDWEGNETQREIDFHNFLFENDKLYIMAWCHLRNEIRQFAVSRIVRLFDANGAEISQPEQYFERMYQESDSFKVAKFFESHFDELMLLVFLAKADGRMMKNERAVIAEYIRCTLGGVDEQFLDNEIKTWQCEFEQFGKSLKSFAAKPQDEKAALASFAEKMYGFKKSPDAMETAALQKIKGAV